MRSLRKKYLIRYLSESSAFSILMRSSWAFGSWFRPILRACGARPRAISFVAPETLAVGVGVRLAVGVADGVGVTMAVGVGVGISIMVGVGVGVMIVFCCSSVLEISASCFLRTADCEYMKIEAEIPTPARIRRMSVRRDDVGALLVMVGKVASCGAGGVIGFCGSGVGSTGCEGGVASGGMAEEKLSGVEGRISGVSSNKSFGGFWVSPEKDGGFGKLFRSSFAINLVCQSWVFVSRKNLVMDKIIAF